MTLIEIKTSCKVILYIGFYFSFRNVHFIELLLLLYVNIPTEMISYGDTICAYFLFLMQYPIPIPMLCNLFYFQ